MASQTPRRSSRIASAAPSAVGSAVSVRTTATTRTNATRARLSQGNLPRLNVQGSSAYGASGNPIVGSNQPVTGDLASLIEKQRGQAIGREAAAGGNPQTPGPPSNQTQEEPDVEAPPSPKEMPPPPTSTRRRVARTTQNGTARTPATRLSANAGDPSFFDSPSKSYGEIRETGLISKDAPRSSRPASRRIAIEETRASPVESIKQTFNRLSLSSLWVILPIFTMMCLFLITSGYLPHKLARLNPFSRIIETGDEALSYYFYDTLTPRVDNIERRLSNVESLQKQIETRLQQQWHTDLQSFRETLPSLIAVTYNKADNAYEIPNELWSAIQGRMSHGGESLSPTDEKTWDAWFKKNQQYVQAMIEQEYDQTLKDKIGTALADKAYVSQDTLLSILDSKYSHLNTDVSNTILRDVKEQLSRVNREAKTVAVSTVQDAFKQLPMRQLEALAQANLARNADLALKRVNFFSPAYSPYILPRFTSQTQTKQQVWLARAYLSVMWIPGPRTPIAALEPWQEPADCWCAAPSSQLGHAQLGIDMAHRVYPTSFTLEHYPKQGLIDWSSAPRDIELWVHINDAEQREAVGAARAAIFGSEDECSPPGRGHKDMVCVGKFTYDVDAPNHVQNFDLDISMKDLGVAVNRLVVRVTSNYGQDWTCIYRILLHGEKV
ncbi:hypothetical protein EJ05DRAFT_146154 [Pseudovirgaria hyperparasitica]|uniref:SUN domain-containing protein n=1 Tax=Pseudovirgaria hyperparasitica TaxID=470096 RepID=A0A6A6VXS5_9PEZI|nr:uncharacterized protein EJ05DRAFT_146154 [Pseudovirgaria hyperparasitica]KAF2754606.1 hypothetical protein EJ05DRAFT_146154 [Pseudovirgaria hyperparasitica]